ncbi:MAG: YqcI/YcgG family protein, partial [Gammaproteobacteria bacterium]
MTQTIKTGHSGEQVFINISSPFHEEHHARNLGSSLTLVVNPRKNFDIVAPKGHQGERVRARIQERARAYEGRAEATPVAFYGDKNHFE